MRYKNESIEQMLSNINIVDIISEKVALKKSGSGFKGLCPFHNEKTPSFIVSAQKNIFKCFGCGMGGGSLNFVMETEKLSYIEAVEYIAERFHFDLEKEANQNSQQDDSYAIIHKILDESRKFFIKQLDFKRSELGFYLEKRKLDNDSIENFSVGFAPNSFNALYNHLKNMNFSDNMMIEAGVVTNSKNNKLVDRFINRLIFPIFSERGKTIGFGGRVFSDIDANKFGKYINSKESKVYHKSEVLYGLSMSKQAINSSKKVIVVEGYLDVIALYKSGVKNIVSASGTAFTDQQIKILKKYTNEMILCFDGDEAGEKATERMIEPVIRNEISCKVVSLPLNEDPDSFVNAYGKDTFLEYVRNNEVNIIDFFINKNLKRGKEENEVLNTLLNILSPLNESTTLFFIFKNLSQKFEIPLNTITNTFRDLKNKSRYNNTENSVVKTQKTLSLVDKNLKSLENELLLIFLDYPNFLSSDIIYLFNNEDIKKILSLLLEFSYTKAITNKEVFLGSLSSEISLNQLNYLKLTKPKFFDDLKEDSVKGILNDYLRKLDTIRNKKYIEEVKKEIININNFFGEFDKEDASKFKKEKKAEILEITLRMKQITRNNYL